jgi:hypothetical protein
MKVVVVGGGRMGQRHVRGVEAAGGTAVVVDPRPETNAAFAALDDALADGPYDAAILAETAAGRLERFALVADAGIASVLVEKPVEQSRERVHAVAEAAARAGVDARVNHFFRTLDVFGELRAQTAPFQLSVTGGAFGIACNGIHWIDAALYLSGDRGGTLLYGELDAKPVESGRGASFRDYGGRALYGFPDGSRLYLASSAGSSAPMQAVLEQPTKQIVFSPGEERAVRYERNPGSELPTYRYGGDYDRRETIALTGDDLWRSTEQWLRGARTHPRIEESVRAHDLLFDLLETSGEHAFAIT